jgi:hypothetical protein
MMHGFALSTDDSAARFTNVRGHYHAYLVVVFLVGGYSARECGKLHKFSSIMVHDRARVGDERD